MTLELTEEQKAHMAFLREKWTGIGLDTKAIDKRKSLQQWVQSQLDQGLEPDIPEELLDAAQRAQAAGFDLTPVQYAALEAIQEHPGMDQARVAEMIGYDRATIGGVIDRLEKKNWIRRVVSERDRRARELSVTAEGNKILVALQPIVQDLQKDILRPLSDADRPG